MVVIESGLIAKTATTVAANALFKSTVDRVERVVKGPAKSATIRALAALKGYQSYLEDTNERVSTFKTFANPTQPVSLLEHFVTLEFETRRNRPILTQDDLLERAIRRPCRFVISGTAGYGKSMAMRYLALSLFENPRGKIPLFLELRHLNRVSAPDLIQYIHASYRRLSQIEIESLRQGLTAGAFILLLDGFDELNHELRPLVENQILDLSKTFPQCSVIVSGRPDDRFSSWRLFTTYRIKPMSKPRVVELLHKLDYDNGVKRRFITKINKGLYETHESFLSTPLLAILMLLTYEQNANIPDKIHLFYAKAFETLFHKHDALKEQYDRSRKSGLQVDEFEKVFSVFCLKSYVQEKTEFTKSELLTALREGLEYEGHSLSSESYLFDVEEAVCLLMKEGTSYFFVHRSFQEYFAAVFLSSCPEDIRDEFIEKVSSRYWDNVLPMLFDMASSQIEPSWVLRKVDEYLDEVNVDGSKPLTPLTARFSGIGYYRSNDVIHISTYLPGKYFGFLAVMRRFYPQLNETEAEINYSLVEKFGVDNWDTLAARDSVVHNLPNGKGTISIKNVVFDAMPPNLPTDSGMVDLCNEEFMAIKEVRRSIKTDQVAKNQFLKKIFTNSS